MSRELRLEQIETVPNQAAVVHYDQLEEPLQHVLPSVVRDDGSTNTEELDLSVPDADYVKFTDYYRISCE